MHPEHEAKSEFDGAAESLHRAYVLLRLSGPLPAPERAGNSLPWMAWLGSGAAATEGRAVLHAHRLASRLKFREIHGETGGQENTLPDPIDGARVMRWLATARHPRPLLRWCEESLRGAGTCPATVAVGVAMAAFHMPRHETLSMWYLLRWRLAWQGDTWPDTRRFLLASGPILPALRRRLLRRTAAFSHAMEKPPVARPCGEPPVIALEARGIRVIVGHVRYRHRHS